MRMCYGFVAGICFQVVWWGDVVVLADGWEVIVCGECMVSGLFLSVSDEGMLLSLVCQCGICNINVVETTFFNLLSLFTSTTSAEPSNYTQKNQHFTPLYPTLLHTAPRYRKTASLLGFSQIFHLYKPVKVH